MYLSNKIVKNKAKEATLTYSNIDVVPVSKLLCPKSIFLIISIFFLKNLQNIQLSIPKIDMF